MECISWFNTIAGYSRFSSLRRWVWYIQVDGELNAIDSPYAITYTHPMKHTSSTQLRANLSKLMDQVNDDHEPLIVTRANGKPVVILSLEDYDEMDATTYLLSSPANAKALQQAIQRLDSGHEGVVKTMEELEAMAQE